MSSATESRARDRQDLIVLSVALVALVVKLCIAWNTLGTNDTLAFFAFASYLNAKGLAETYRSVNLFNHPPLIAYYLEAIAWLHNLPAAPKSTFRVLLRLPGILADFGSILVLISMAKSEFRLRPPYWVLILFAASPVSIMVSGFHGNTDSVVVLLLLLATALALRDHAALCGVALALSCQVKVIPLLLAPVFFFFWLHRGQAFRFSLWCGATWLVACIQPLIESPAAYVKDVLAYGSYSGLWGITYVLRLTGVRGFEHISPFNLSLSEVAVATALKASIAMTVLILAWRARKLPKVTLPATLAIAWLLFFVISPGVAPQYMVWLAPFILLASPRWYVAVTAASTFFLFSFYNKLSGRFPWYYTESTNALADSWAPSTLVPWLTMLAMLVLFRHRRENAAVEMKAVTTEVAIER